MKYLKVIFLLQLSLLLITGCWKRPAPENIGTFPFTFENNNYEILSVLANGYESGNILIHRVENTVLLRAADYDQDGDLDSVIIGTISLEMANRIYLAGIELAKQEHHYDEKKHSRRFELAGYDEYYVIETYFIDPNHRYNKFIIIDLQREENEILIDLGADGTLDEVISGEGALSAYQQTYYMVVKRGELKGRIKKENKLILVEKE